jgi:uncharacterized protein involved in cysteine biosynthesis
MTDKSQRKKFGNINRYQMAIIMATFMPTLIICFAITILLIICYWDLIDIIVNQSAATSIQIISDWSVLIVSVVWIAFALLLLWAYYLSLRLVGPFERINRELDEIIEGKHRNKITARKKDNLAKELLQRINVLIERLP